jgi:hypothetical protein
MGVGKRTKLLLGETGREGVERKSVAEDKYDCGICENGEWHFVFYEIAGKFVASHIYIKPYIVR